MLAVTEKRAGDDAMKARSSQSIELSPPSLADMGVTANQSSNWQSLAAMSDESSVERRDQGKKGAIGPTF